MKSGRWIAFLSMSTIVVGLAGCGSSNGSNRQPDRRGPRSGDRGGRDGSVAAVPIETVTVRRGAIAQHLETNGVLEAENEVDIVARVTGPITELSVEEGMSVKQGQLLARIDEREYKAQVAAARVNRDEAKLNFDRARATLEQQLISQETFDAAQARLEAAEAQLESAALSLGYTKIRAPFDGLIAVRYVKLAQHVSPGTALFRISDFTPLLCPIQVPEKELARLKRGQRAALRVEAFPGQEFTARVLRISPTVDPSTGTIKVTLDVDGRDKLRPGMFASVFLETDVHENALIIPKVALVLDSIGDVVFIMDKDVAARREVVLGFRTGDTVEVIKGLKEGEPVITLGQDGLADGTPVRLLADSAATSRQNGPSESPSARRATTRSPEPGRALAAANDSGRGAARPAREWGDRRRPPGEMPPGLAERIRNAKPEELERIKQRMRDRGLSEDEIERRIARARKSDGESR
jgi:membrane fusion protein (multidrug efflux system)